MNTACLSLKHLISGCIRLCSHRSLTISSFERIIGLILIFITAGLLLAVIPAKSYALLQFVEAQYEGTGLEGVCDVAVSLDGSHV